MRIEKIINGLDSLAQLCHNQSITAKTKYARDLWDDMDSVATEALALLKTHPEAKPNEPLTLEELRKMEGQPVWVQLQSAPEYGSWKIVAGVDIEHGERTLYCYGDYVCRYYGTMWLAYRRPPKEDTV